MDSTRRPRIWFWMGLAWIGSAVVLGAAAALGRSWLFAIVAILWIGVGLTYMIWSRKDRSAIDGAPPTE